MLNVALTGGIACGKSLVGALLASHGAEICEADVLAHEVMAPGGPAYDGILEAFGAGVLDPISGAVDRTRLGRRVFRNPEELARLNVLVHPHVKRRWRGWLRSRRAGVPAAVVVIPLLYEIRAENEWDLIVSVGASAVVQVARLRRRGLSAEEAARRLAAQMPVSEKIIRGDIVIMNDGGKQALREQAARLWRRIVKSPKRAAGERL